MKRVTDNSKRGTEENGCKAWFQEVYLLRMVFNMKNCLRAG